MAHTLATTCPVRLLRAYHLTKDEIECAHTVGRIRNHLAHGQSNRGAVDPLSTTDRLRMNVFAAAAEIAVSRILRLSWSGCGQGTHRPGDEAKRDVGDFFEVRYVEDTRRGLLVRDSDHEAPFVLMQKEEGYAYQIVGWEWKSVVKIEGRILHASNAPDCYIQPRQNLQRHDALWRTVVEYINSIE